MADLKTTHQQSIRPTAWAMNSQKPHHCRSTCPADQTPIRCDCDCVSFLYSRDSNTWTPCRHWDVVPTRLNYRCHRRTASDGVRDAIDAIRNVDDGMEEGAVVGRLSDDFRHCDQSQPSRSFDWKRLRRERTTDVEQDQNYYLWYLWLDCRLRMNFGDAGDCSCDRIC